jgi:hypothetical protein
MAIIAIHQPNYFPWLGYFWKVSHSSTFVFLDDVQFSKNSFTNRTQVLCDGKVKWLTVPVRVRLGDIISAVLPVGCDWIADHVRALHSYYRGAAAFRQSWPVVEQIYATAPDGDLAVINRHFVTCTARKLGLETEFVAASALGELSTGSSERLIEIIRRLAPGGTYLSGHGGAKYQDTATFSASGISLTYTDFCQPNYRQLAEKFFPGLSILDAIFNVGWAETARFVCGGE